MAADKLARLSIYHHTLTSLITSTLPACSGAADRDGPRVPVPRVPGDDGGRQAGAPVARGPVLRVALAAARRLTGGAQRRESAGTRVCTRRHLPWTDG